LKSIPRVRNIFPRGSAGGEGDRAHSEHRNAEDSGGGDLGVGKEVFRGVRGRTSLYNKREFGLGRQGHKGIQAHGWFYGTAE
jgi:hypothetical protein